ncbi:MAG: hypothetical protein HOV71_00785 [Hamadaea sp.]|nr:hypothetical protein [Hamadaea sp.]NUR46644.1 hypothetical protein [Hamadaea sp.]NUT07251.1 hypothetical protein [Hamadaea sp.]
MTEHSLDTGCGEPAPDRRDHDRWDHDRWDREERSRRQVIPAPIEWLVFIDAIKARRADE